MLTTDPAKRYAQMKPFTNTVERVFTGEAVNYNEGWTRIVEIENLVVAPGYVWRGGADFYDPANPPLEEKRAEALYALDQKAGEVRKRYITVAPGQEATYLIKEREAEAFRTALYLGTPPPMVQAEANATGSSTADACALILGQRDLWVLKAAQIEAARRSGKVEVGAAATLSEIDTARDAGLTALDAL